MLNIVPPNYQYCPMCSNKLDDNGHVARYSKVCPQCHWVYYPHVGCAAAAVIVQGDKVLLVKRKNEPYKNTWMFPAGFVDFGEAPQETIIREVREETGLEISGLNLIDVLQNPDDPRSVGHFGIFYKVNSFAGEIRAQNSEVAEVEWFSLENLPRIGWESHNRVIELLNNI